MRGAFKRTPEGTGAVLPGWADERGRQRRRHRKLSVGFESTVL